MRTLVAILVLIALPLAVLGEDGPSGEAPHNGDQPAAVNLTLNWHADATYTTTQTERVENNTTFEVINRDGERIILVGLLNDRHQRRIVREAIQHDEDGLATGLSVHVAEHNLTRHQQPPGEAGSELVYEGNGPLARARWTETWEGEYWRRRLVEAAHSPLGDFPRELLDAMRRRDPVRTHFMLPADAVREGAEWIPDTAYLLAQLESLKAGEDAPEVTATCRLKSLREGRAVIELEWKITGLKPATSELQGRWNDGVQVTVEGKAELVINMDEEFAASYESETTLKLEGEIRRDGRWIKAIATFVSNLSESTVKKKVADE
jgi:hypothetical protein